MSWVFLFRYWTFRLHQNLIKKYLGEHRNLPHNNLSTVWIWFPPPNWNEKPFLCDTESERNLHVFSKEITAFLNVDFGAYEEGRTRINFHKICWHHRDHKIHVYSKSFWIFAEFLFKTSKSTEENWERVWMFNELLMAVL